MLARRSVVSMSNDAIRISLLTLLSHRVQVVRPPLNYSFVSHTVGISNSRLLHLGIVARGTDRMIDT